MLTTTGRGEMNVSSRCMKRMPAARRTDSHSLMGNVHGSAVHCRFFVHGAGWSAGGPGGIVGGIAISGLRVAAMQRREFQTAQELAECPCYVLKSGPKAVHLRTAVHAIHAPLAEVLTVVTEEAIALLSEPRPGAPHDLFTLLVIGTRGSHPYRAPLSKARERYFFDWTPAPVKYKAAIVHNNTAAHIDTVMCIA